MQHNNGSEHGSLKWRRTDTPLSSSSSTSSSISCNVPIPPHLDTKSLQDIVENDDLRDLVTREVMLCALKRNGGYRGGALLDILTRPPATEMQSLTGISSRWPVFADSQSRAEFWLNHELSISIEYAKTHEAFRNLNFCDKCLLLEETHVVLFIFTAAYEAYFNQDKYIRYSNGDKVEFLEDTGSPNDLIGMMVQCSIDPVTFAITKSIILLNPNICGLSSEGRTQMEAERERYLHLLSSYFSQRFGDGGVSILAKCIHLSSTSLALGLRFRQKPPANAQLLHLIPLLPGNDA